ncbi:MAG: type II secretion system secretin GspD [Phycisphaeraceae bacterium]
MIRVPLFDRGIVPVSAVAVVTCLLLSMWYAPVATAQANAPEEGEVADESAPLRLNFRDATVDTILRYLSEQAGLIVVTEADLNGRVSLFNHQPVTLKEAVALLNTVLKEQGYAAIRREKVLQIVPLSDARHMDLPVRVGSDPAALGASDTLITQVIPLRRVRASEMAENLTLLLDPEAGNLSANEGSNALIVTSTERNVRSIVEVVHALEQSMSRTQVADVRVFHLEHASAPEVAQLVTETFQADASDDDDRRRMPWQRRRSGDDGDEQRSGPEMQIRAAANERTNSMVVTGPSDTLEVIAEVVTDLDTDTAARQGVLTYHAKHSTVTELQTLFTDLFAEQTNQANGNGARPQPRWRRGGDDDQQSGGEDASDLIGNVTAVADQSTNTLLVLTQEANFPRIRAILEELDRPVPQVMVRVLVAELTHSDALDFGTELEGIIDVADDTLIQALTTFGSPSDGLNLAVIDDDYSASIHALQTIGALEVLSRPYILTRDNQQATIHVGEQVPFITNTRVTDTGQTINTIEYRDVGIILGVTPQINDEGLVVLNVSQELSALQASTVPISENLNASLIAQRTAETRVAVGNRQTVVLGGLMEDRLDLTVNQVPLLGDIPLLGELFKRTEREESKTELLLFLTPEVVMKPGDLEAMTERVRRETEQLDDTVNPGRFQEHLDSLKAQEPARNSETEPSEP